MGGKNPRELGRLIRKKRIRKKVKGTLERPRLSVFRSLKHIYAQIIADDLGKTLVSASTLSLDIRDQVGKNSGNIQGAKAVGKFIAQLALNKGIEKVVFDRNGYLYHGRINALAEAAREAGLIF